MSGAKVTSRQASWICLSVISCTTYAEVELITAPKQGEEYVFVQTANLGARPIESRNKPTFETSHKIPHFQTRPSHESESIRKYRKIREAKAEDTPAPAPAGAIKLDPLKLIERYKTVLKTSTTEKPKHSQKSSRSGQNSSPKVNKRIKKDARSTSVTDPTPVLTSSAPFMRIEDDDSTFLASGSEKQRSRIQIKKGPNGQEYEYEYVYYYYDDEDDKQDKVSNRHDGPARNQLTELDESIQKEPTINEVVPSSRSLRPRGRQLDTDENVSEERLPSNTRFPPRSRNLGTTPLPDTEDKTTRRPRIRTTTDASSFTEAESSVTESQGNRNRNRANVRRPSLELVDSASFNTHSGTAGSDSTAGIPSFPPDLPAGPVRFLGATPNERPETTLDSQTEKLSEQNVLQKNITEYSPTEASVLETTTAMSPMNKVALDLYAILQGTQKLSDENSETNTEEEQDSTTVELSTDGSTTELTSTAAITTASTTTTTTTTTSAPTSTTTEPTVALGRGRYRGRGTVTQKTTTSTTEISVEGKPKKFSRPSFGSRPRANPRTTESSPIEQEITKSQIKPAGNSRPSRPRFSGSRNRPRTSVTEETSNEDASSTPASNSRGFVSRPKTSFNTRTRGKSTPIPENVQSSSDDTSGSSTETLHASSSTQKPKPRISSVNSIKSIRPGPRINLSRGRLGSSTSTTTELISKVSDIEAEEDPEQRKENEEENKENTQEQEVSSASPQDNSPLSKLRNRNRIVPTSRPKTQASAPVQVRRINPLLARRKPSATEPTSSETPQEISVSEEAPAEPEEAQEDETPPLTSSTTTEEPRGLNKLLAGRRRLASRQPGTIN